MATKKITKRERFANLLTYSEVQANPEMVEFIEHEIELLERKNSNDKKPTAQQVKNNGIKTAIAEGMEQDRLYTVTEIIKEIPACHELSNQHVSALLRQMVIDNTIVKIEEKRKSFFQTCKGD